MLCILNAAFNYILRFSIFFSSKVNLSSSLGTVPTPGLPGLQNLTAPTGGPGYQSYTPGPPGLHTTSPQDGHPGVATVSPGVTGAPGVSPYGPTGKPGTHSFPSFLPEDLRISMKNRCRS